MMSLGKDVEVHFKHVARIQLREPELLLMEAKFQA